MNTETKPIGDPTKLLRKSGRLAITIRPMRQQDLMEVSRIEKDVYSGVRHWRYDELFQALGEQSMKCLVATPKWDHNEILGYAICKNNYDPSRFFNSWIAEIQNITVVEKMQRNGIGLNLIAEIAKTHYKLTAMVSEYAVKTQMFFRSCGFDCVKVEKEVYSFTTRSGETIVFDAYCFEMEVR
jgi:ribosomal protein S18 acetylase RimI-like enzyme